MELKSQRSEKFKLWLKDLTPEKTEKLVTMERKVRMLEHVFALCGEVDTKIFADLRQLSNEIRVDYEKLEANENKSDEHHLQPV